MVTENAPGRSNRSRRIVTGKRSRGVSFCMRKIKCVSCEAENEVPDDGEPIVAHYPPEEVPEPATPAAPSVEAKPQEPVTGSPQPAAPATPEPKRSRWNFSPWGS